MSEVLWPRILLSKPVTTPGPKRQLLVPYWLSKQGSKDQHPEIPTPSSVPFPLQGYAQHLPTGQGRAERVGGRYSL